LAHQVCEVADAAGGAQAHGHVQGATANSAGLLGLVLCSVGRREQRQVEGPATHVTAVHFEGPLGELGSVASLAEVPEALGHPRRQIGLVEVGQPCRVVFAHRAVEGPFRRS